MAKKQNIPAANIPFIDQYNGHISPAWYLYLSWLSNHSGGGEVGPQGPEGPAGPQGPQGIPGNVEFNALAPEQVEMLKGDPGPAGKDGDRGLAVYATTVKVGPLSTHVDFVNFELVNCKIIYIYL